MSYVVRCAHCSGDIRLCEVRVVVCDGCYGEWPASESELVGVRVHPRGRPDHFVELCPDCLPEVIAADPISR